jgi:hypothetical protein
MHLLAGILCRPKSHGGGPGPRICCLRCHHEGPMTCDRVMDAREESRFAHLGFTVSECCLLHCGHLPVTRPGQLDVRTICHLQSCVGPKQDKWVPAAHQDACDNDMRGTRSAAAGWTIGTSRQDEVLRRAPRVFCAWGEHFARSRPGRCRSPAGPAKHAMGNRTMARVQRASSSSGVSMPEERARRRPCVDRDARA